MSSDMDDLNEINMVTVSEAAGAVQNDDYSWRVSCEMYAQDGGF
jgi:hypothetical protein